jgi:predicted PilT family ATPase
MLSVKMPNGKVIQCDPRHFDEVIKVQHKGAEIVQENTTKEVVAEAPIQEDVAVSISSMTKGELEVYTLEKYGVDLDKRKSLKNLVAQVEELGG